MLTLDEKLEKIPDDIEDWQVEVRGAKTLANNLSSAREEALLYRQLATLRADVPLKEELTDLRWEGPKRADLEALCVEIGFERFLEELDRT